MRPSLTSRALAEFAHKTFADQMRILAEQKHPRGGAALFKLHYYQSARAAIYQYFKHGNDPSKLDSARKRLAAKKMAQHKKDHNGRAIEQFRKMKSLNGRKLVPWKSSVVRHECHSVEIRFFADLSAAEAGQAKGFIFNFTARPVEEDLARRILEVTHWMCDCTKPCYRAADLEFVDLPAGVVIRGRKPRKTTLDLAQKNLHIISHLWPAI